MRVFLSITLLAFIFILTFPALGQDKKAESVYDRVMRTGTIRCGYWSWEPLFVVDTNTKKMSGIFKDVMDEVARVSELKIEWSREVTFADLVSDLNTGKIDALCAGVWPSPLRAKYIEFTSPIFFISMNAYKKAGDKRFDNNKNSMMTRPSLWQSWTGKCPRKLRMPIFHKQKPLIFLRYPA